MMQSTLLIPAWQNGILTPIDKLSVHRLGLRHPAVSVFVTGPDGILLQRRAVGKYHSAGLWANTCCTHPYWGEEPQACALRRLDQELGLTGIPLIWRDQIEYRADVGNGLTEHEVVEVYLGEITGGVSLIPDPDEVWETAWMTVCALDSAIAETPARFTPWLRIYMAQHRSATFG